MLRSRSVKIGCINAAQKSLSMKFCRDLGSCPIFSHTQAHRPAHTFTHKQTEHSETYPNKQREGEGERECEGGKEIKSLSETEREKEKQNDSQRKGETHRQTKPL